MRIVSLLPSATEIIADLGLSDSLVGRSHECHWPESVRHVPVVSSSRIDSANLSGRQIDDKVNAAVVKGGALYAIDAKLLAALKPDVIVTQDLCKVCAVSGEDLVDTGAKTISLGPRTLSEVAESVSYLARELGVPEKGAAAAMVRTSDMDAGSDFLSAALFVSAGSTWGDTGFVCTNDVAPAVGSDNIDFVQFTGAYQVVAGAGLTKTGNTLDVGAGDGIAADADAVRVRLAANKGLAFASGEIAVQVDNTRAMYLSGSGFLRVGFDLAQAIYVNGSNLLAVRADSNYGMSIDATTGLRVDILSGGALEFESGDLDVKDLGIDTARLAADAVTTAKIANEAVTLAKLAPDVQHKLGGYDSSFDYEIVSDNEVVSLPNGCEATVPDHLLFVNGRLMRIGASKDYTINGSNQIVFAGGFITGDTLQIIFNNMSA